MRTTIVEIIRGKNPDQFFFRAKARNGKIITQSEAYTRPWSARRGAARAHPEADMRDLTK